MPAQGAKNNDVRQCLANACDTCLILHPGLLCQVDAIVVLRILVNLRPLEQIHCHHRVVHKPVGAWLVQHSPFSLCVEAVHYLEVQPTLQKTHAMKAGSIQGLVMLPENANQKSQGETGLTGSAGSKLETRLRCGTDLPRPDTLDPCLFG